MIDGAVTVDADGRPRVQIETGQLRGVVVGRTHTWRGIPYAAPPVDGLRWRAPAPAAAWPGVRDGADFRSAAPQNPRYTLIGFRKYQPTGEDCLTLNVVTPVKPAARPRPVMVFIHGGAYLLGSSATPLYLGHSLAERGDVVFVSINYRLGALGYLDLTEFSTPAQPIESNLGLRDQLAALAWVQRNIAAFGGDPTNVTVFGESAGGNAVTTLLATPAARGLFHRAIAQSSAPGLTVPAATARGWARTYLRLLGGSEALWSADTRTIGRAGGRLLRELERQQPGLVPYGPVVDGELLPADPAEAIAAGDGIRVPLIIGTNRDEGTLFSRFGPLAAPTPEVMARVIAASPEQLRALGSAYPGFPAKPAWRRILGDQIFWAPSLRIAEAHSRHAPTYAYRYDYAPTAFRLAGLGSTHAGELMAVFGTFPGPAGVLAAGDRSSAIRVTNEVQRDWITFARTGRPASPWPRFDGAERRTRIIGAHSRVESDPHARARRAWEASGLPGSAPVPRGT